MGGYPNFDAWLGTAWGAGEEFWSSGPTNLFRGASNLVFGQNPPYYLDDFLSVYPKFFGLGTSLSGVGLTAGSNVLTVARTIGLGYGMFLQCTGLPKGSIITGLGTGAVTVNTAATVTAAGVTLQVYEAPPIPVAVTQLYINLATASLVYARWQDSWFIAIAWFVAHYLTLYAKSDASEVGYALQASVHGEAPTGAIPGTVYTLSEQPPGDVLSTLTKNGAYLTPGIDYTLSGLTITLTVSTVLNNQLYATWLVQTQVLTPGVATGAQIASQGLAGGIQVSKGVGDVSVSYQSLESLEQWGQWNLTAYGQQLAGMAAVIGMGPMVVW